MNFIVAAEVRAMDQRNFVKTNYEKQIQKTPNNNINLRFCDYYTVQCTYKIYKFFFLN